MKQGQFVNMVNYLAPFNVWIPINGSYAGADYGLGMPEIIRNMPLDESAIVFRIRNILKQIMVFSFIWYRNHIAPNLDPAVDLSLYQMLTAIYKNTKRFDDNYLCLFTYTVTR
jgi:hypothetical protein